MRNIIYDITHHLFHYAILLLIIFGGLLAFFSFRGYPQTQFLIGLVVAFAYTIWGIIHHLVERNLTVKIIIEYLLISLLAIVILWNFLI